VLEELLVEHQDSGTRYSRFKFNFFNNYINRWWRWRYRASCNPTGLAGGSGGGRFKDRNSYWSGGAGNTPPVSPPQGNNGGICRLCTPNMVEVVEEEQQLRRSWNPCKTGGAGGAGSATTSISGTQQLLMQVVVEEVELMQVETVGTGGAGGGGGKWRTSTPSTAGTAGTANTGGGGGGGGDAVPVNWWSWRFRNSYYKVQISIKYDKYN
jgi:hypothetical protein